MRTLLPAALSLFLLGAGCGGGAGVGEQDLCVRVTGRLVDDETGRPVSRDAIYIHAFNDEVPYQVSLEPDDETTFELGAPEPNVRLRIADTSNEYELYERTFTVENGALDVEVRLKPTHWVRLHGTVLWRDGAAPRPLREGDGNVRHGQVSLGRYGLHAQEDGTYATRVPRERFEVLVINTSYSPQPREVDLRGVTGEEHELDFVLTR